MPIWLCQVRCRPLKVSVRFPAFPMRSPFAHDSQQFCLHCSQSVHRSLTIHSAFILFVFELSFGTPKRKDQSLQRGQNKKGTRRQEWKKLSNYMYIRNINFNHKVSWLLTEIALRSVCNLRSPTVHLSLTKLRSAFTQRTFTIPSPLVHHSLTAQVYRDFMYISNIWCIIDISGISSEALIFFYCWPLYCML